MKQVSASEIVYHPMSNGERDIRLLWWQGKLYRGMKGSKADFYRNLYDRKIINRIVEKGLFIDTTLASLQVDGFDLVLQHRVLPFVSYPFEWCPAMLKAGALLIIDLSIELNQWDLIIKDPHSWNVLFDGANPIYVDLGSIVPAQENTLWPGYDCFCRFILYPLYLMSKGQARIARWLLHDGTQGVLEREVAAVIGKTLIHSNTDGLLSKRLISVAKVITPYRLRRLLSDQIRKIRSSKSWSCQIPNKRLNFLFRLREEVEHISIPSQPTDWSNYYKGFLPFHPTDQWETKQYTVFKLLTDLKPVSVLDIGSNRGWYSQMIANLGTKVVAFDIDEPSITKLYCDAKEKDFPISPLIMNFTSPSPRYGVGDKRSLSASQRLKCELVLALALVHHLVFKQHLSFERIVEGLAEFSIKWLLVEFIPKEDLYVSQWWSGEFLWYTLDNFVNALKKQFFDIKVFPSYPEPRVLLFCKKNR